MTKLRLDKVSFASGVDTYINYATLTTTIRLFGSFPSGSGASFTATIPYSRGKTRADLYSYNAVTGVKMPLTPNSRVNPFQFTSTEFYNLTASYDGTTITFTATITNNSGVRVTTDQTLTLSAVLYEVPYVQ